MPADGWFAGIRRALAFGLVGLLVACSAAAPTGSPSAAPTTSTVPASASLPASPSPSPATPSASLPATPTSVAPSPTSSPSGTASPTPVGPRAQQIGQFATDAFVVGVVGFAAGYVVALEDRNGAAYWFSIDGRTWQPGSLSQQVQNCSGGLSPDSYGSGAGVEEEHVVIYGGVLDFSTQNCANPDQGFGGGEVVWRTVDGQNWTRSDVFGQRDSVIDDVWPIPAGAGIGWEASVSSSSQPTAIWQSSDGQSWNQVASFAGQVGSGSRAAIAADETRLLMGSLASGETGLLTSTDGVTWTELPVQPAFADSESIQDVVAPPPGGGWLVVSADTNGSVLWTSTDFQSWQRHAFPGGRIVTNIAGIDSGYVASGERSDLYFTVCDDVACPGPAERQYLGGSSLSWTEVLPRMRGGAWFAQGPAGIIAVGRFDGTVWLIEP